MFATVRAESMFGSEQKWLSVARNILLSVGSALVLTGPPLPKLSRAKS
jgi:hypothetical protein